MVDVQDKATQSQIELQQQTTCCTHMNDANLRQRNKPSGSDGILPTHTHHDHYDREAEDLKEYIGKLFWITLLLSFCAFIMIMMLLTLPNHSNRESYSFTAYTIIPIYIAGSGTLILLNWG